MWPGERPGAAAVFVSGRRASATRHGHCVIAPGGRTACDEGSRRRKGGGSPCALLSGPSGARVARESSYLYSFGCAATIGVFDLLGVTHEEKN